MLRPHERQIWLLKLNGLCQTEAPLPQLLRERGWGEGGLPQLLILLLRPLCRPFLP